MLIRAIALLALRPKGLRKTGPLVRVCGAEPQAPRAPAGRWSA
jgi:hypothetical protein